MSPAPEPLAGWQRRFVTDAERARNLGQEYRRAGFEVRIAAAVPEDFDESCAACALVQSRLFRIVYTRRKGEAP
jgi:hypothetical protein